MTDVPDYVARPYPPVHIEPPRNTQWQGMSQDQLNALRSRLIESLIQVVVQAVTGIFTPGGGIGGALTQLQSWASNLPLLSDLFGDDFLEDFTDALGDFDDFFDLIVKWISDLIFEGILGIGRGTDDPIIDLQNILRNIPFFNILGIGGPANIGGSMTSTWDQLIGGFVGTVGSGAGLADLFNVGQEIASNAIRGFWSFDILGIRNNKSFSTGFNPTTQSNITLETLALGVSSLPTFAVTQSTAITGYHRIAEASEFALVSWQGYGVTSVTDCYVNIYKMNTTTGDNDLVHASANIIGDLTGGSVAVPVVYEPSPAIAVEPGEVYGIEIAIRGAGTHNIAGTQSGLQDQAFYPRRYSSVRNSGTSPAPSSFTPTYDTNVPFIEFGVSAGDVSIPHSPEIRQFSTPGTTSYPIPTWANYVDRVVLGGAGGGHQGGTWGVGGEGGDNATWARDTLTRGVDYSGAASLTTAVGAGGTGGSGSGANGGTSTSSISGSLILSSTGGVGANSFDVLGSEHAGESPGNTAFLGGGSPTIVGGPQQNTYGANGAPPGAGGAGGNWASFQFGGDGAPGTILYRFRQT